MDSEEDKRAFEEFKKLRATNIAHIEVRTEPNPPKTVREKKPRTEKQKEGFQKMREALQRKREAVKEAKHEVSKAQKAKLDKAYEEAEKVKEILPLAHVVVKRNCGRPRGVKNSRPTPAYDSDPELEEMPPLEAIQEETVKVLPKMKRSLTKPPTMTVEDQMSLYMRKLNGM